MCLYADVSTRESLSEKDGLACLTTTLLACLIVVSTYHYFSLYLIIIFQFHDASLSEYKS